MKITTEDKISMNCAMAYFMEWRIDNSFPDKNKVWRLDKNVELRTTLKFSTDWNVLMEVFIKVNNLSGHSCTIVDDVFRITTPKGIFVTKYEFTSLMEEIFLTIGEFIQEYNYEQFKSK